MDGVELPLEFGGGRAGLLQLAVVVLELALVILVQLALVIAQAGAFGLYGLCLLYTSPSPRDRG